MTFVDKLLFETDILDQRITNPLTGNKITVSSALQYPDKTAVKKKALQLIKKAREKAATTPQPPTPPIAKVAPEKEKPAPPTKIVSPEPTKDVQPKKNARSHKPKSQSYGISKDCVDFLKSKGLGDLNVLPQSFVKREDLIFNPKIETEGKDNVWAVKFPVIVNGQKAVKTAYTKGFMKKGQKNKYKKISKIKEEDLIKLDMNTDKLMNSPTQQIADSACIIKIILKTGLRIGSADSEDKERNYTGNLGVRTLKKNNIKVNGNVVSFKFIGKGYQENIAEIKDKDIANYLSKRLNSIGDNENVFSASYPEVGKVMRKINPKGVNPKDLRTYKATQIAKNLLAQDKKSIPKDADPKSIKKYVKDKLKDVFEKVAQALNNTPSMAKNSYVHPKIITDFLDSLGLKPQYVGYKHITMEVKGYKSRYVSMFDEIFNKPKMLSEEESAKEISNDLDTAEEFPIPKWFFDDNIALVKKDSITESASLEIPPIVIEKFKGVSTNTPFSFIRVQGKMWRRNNSTNEITFYSEASNQTLPK